MNKEKKDKGFVCSVVDTFPVKGKVITILKCHGKAEETVTGEEMAERGERSCASIGEAGFDFLFQNRGRIPQDYWGKKFMFPGTPEGCVLEKSGPLEEDFSVTYHAGKRWKEEEFGKDYFLIVISP